MKGFILIPLVAALLATSSQADDDWYTLSGHVPKIVSQLQPVGRLESSQRLKLTFGVASRDGQGLAAFLKDVYDPASANYRHYLTPKQFTEKFGPAEQDYNAVIDYVKASGLTVTGQHSNRVVLDVEGAVADIEKALKVTLRTYQHPTEARTFFAPDAEPSLPVGLRVLHIAGLNNYTLAHPKLRHRADAVSPKSGSAPGGWLWGNDFRHAYVPGTTLTGAGQSVGLLEFESFYPSDITDYENAIGMSATVRPQLVTVHVDGVSTTDEAGDNGEECSLDIELSLSMAPGLSKIYVFEGGITPQSNGPFDDVLESMVSYTNIRQFSCSWGGSTDVDPTSELLFQEMAAQGQSFFDASGDAGAFVGPVQFPSDSPSITQVGGTTLAVGAAPAHAWASEVAWDPDAGPNISFRDAASTSGGISTYYGIPDWQSNVSMTANMGSTNMRNTPDVAANANNVYIYTDNGQAHGGWEGTSCAAPLWAGFAALMNQQAVAGKVPPVGFLNPALYTLAARADNARFFHDITSGNNTWRESPDQFYAVAGYDLCCGIGSMNGISMMNAIVFPASLITGSLAVVISPASAIASGAKWQLDGGAWQASGATVTNIETGNHTVSFNKITGWEAPDSQSVVIAFNVTTTTSATYTAIDSLKVSIGPALAVGAGAQWAVDGEQLQGSGATVADLPPGSYVVSFSAVNGWTAPANRTVSVKAGSVQQFTGTYTFDAAGIYNGLFMQANVTEGTSGMLSGLDVTASGTYSGKLLIAGSTNTIAGSFNSLGQASNHIARPATKGGAVTLLMNANWNESPPNITGTVSGTNGGGWVAYLTNELAVAGATSREYTVLIPPGTPAGCGYLLITNHAGVVALSGALGDGTPFSQGVLLSGDGDLPVYGTLYGNTGLILGWIGLEGGSPVGNLTWIKPARAGALYANGFTNMIAVEGSAWTNPLPHTAAIDVSSGQLTFSGGNLSNALSFTVAISSNNVVGKLTGIPTNTLTGSINPKTGLLTVTFGNGAGKATTTGSGAVLQNTAGGGGFFLGKTNTGAILLAP